MALFLRFLLKHCNNSPPFSPANIPVALGNYLNKRKHKNSKHTDNTVVLSFIWSFKRLWVQTVT